MAVFQADGKATTSAELPSNNLSIVRLLNENDILKRRCSFRASVYECIYCELKTNCKYRKTADRMSNNDW